jgi:hypothetical protein
MILDCLTRFLELLEKFKFIISTVFMCFRKPNIINTNAQRNFAEGIDSKYTFTTYPKHIYHYQ